MKKILILIPVVFLASCEKTETQYAKIETRQVSQRVQDSDFDKFIVKVFSAEPRFKSKSQHDLYDVKTFELKNGKGISIVIFSTPETETFVIWEKVDGVYTKLFTLHDRGGAIEQVLEYDLDNDKDFDLILKSDCESVYGTYSDIFLNQTANGNISYERLLKTEEIDPIIVNLNSDQLPEIILVEENDLPFGLNSFSFKSDDNRFVHNEASLKHYGKQKLIEGWNPDCDPMVNTPLLANYPVKIFNASKFGALIEVTDEFPELLALHIESVFYSNFLTSYDKNPRMKLIWQNYVLTYLDSYYILKTDSSYVKYLEKKQREVEDSE